MNTEAIEGLLLTLERDLNDGGWDQPSSLWVVEAIEEDDPYFVKLCDFHQHPCEVMDSLPVLDKPRARGIVLASEAWMVESDGQLSQTIAERLAHLGLTESERKRLLRELARREASMIRPSLSPDRVEVRFVQCMTKDGAVVVVMRTRDKEPERLDQDIEGRIYDSMQRALGIKEQA